MSPDTEKHQLRIKDLDDSGRERPIKPELVSLDFLIHQYMSNNLKYDAALQTHMLASYEFFQFREGLTKVIDTWIKEREEKADA